MAITVQLPQDIEQQLESEWPELPRKVLEAIAVEAYRQGKLSSRQVGRILELDYWQTVEFLSERGVYPNYTLEEFEQDLRADRELRKR